MIKKNKIFEVFMKTDKLLLVRPILGIFSLFGIVLAKGWTSTIAAIFFPPWAWYLAAEYFISLLNKL